jgi:hypothetical protein
MHKIYVALLLGFLLSGCEQNIDFELKQKEDVLVVDANIENGLYPEVILTKSLEYFSNINPQIVADAFVHNAEITISNGILTHRLKEDTIPVIPGINFYVYRIDSADLATAFKGSFDTRYTLKILAGGKEYNASTSIPVLAKKPDSMWWKKAPFQEDTTRVVVMVKTTDPPGLGNCVRYFTRKNSEPLWPGENSVFDDQVIDGTTYELQIQPGIDRNNRVADKDNYFNRGDTITLKLCNIDRATYNFWNTWEFSYQSIGNPFAQPNKVLGNISNGALGAFYGYAAFYKTLIIPE